MQAQAEAPVIQGFWTVEFKYKGHTTRISKPLTKAQMDTEVSRWVGQNIHHGCIVSEWRAQRVGQVEVGRTT